MEESVPSLWELLMHPYVFALGFDLVMGLITGYLIVKFGGLLFK